MKSMEDYIYGFSKKWILSNVFNKLLNNRCLERKIGVYNKIYMMLFFKWCRTLPLYQKWTCSPVKFVFTPANIHLDEDVLTTSFVFVFKRRLQDVFKTSWSRRICSPQPYVFRKRLQDVLVKTNIFVLAIRLQDVFKTFSRRLQDVLQKRLQDIFKTSSRRFEDVFKTSSRRLAKISSRRFQGVPSS